MVELSNVTVQFGSQVLFGLAGGGIGSADIVAWWSHIGGFLAGLVLIGLFLPRRGF